MIHLYWAMKNCSDSPRELIMNISCHIVSGTFAHSRDEPSPTTGLAYHHNVIIMAVYLQLCHVMYMS